LRGTVSEFLDSRFRENDNFLRDCYYNK